MSRIWIVPGIFAMVLPLVLIGRAEAGSGFLRASSETGDDGNGPYTNLIVREIRVTPIVAHVGDTVRIEMVLENGGENVNKTIPLEIRANKKVVASRWFTFGWGDGPGKIFRETFEWNTSGVPPGEYRIKGDAFVWEDNSPFDNDLSLKEKLVLLPAGAPLPEGKTDGGTAIATDPRWNPKRAGGSY